MSTQDFKIIDLSPENIAEYGVCGYKDVTKHLELRRKIEWFKRYYPLGLRIKALITDTGGYQGMIEYIPGEFVHRPVSAAGYLFIHCLFVGFRNEYKDKGYASKLMDICIEEAQQSAMHGVAVVTRKGSFMADNRIFLKKGFICCDKAKPDFELMVLKTNPSAPDPKFCITPLGDNHQGLTIIMSPQCPYSVKNVESIIKTAEKMKIAIRLIEADEHSKVQESPCAFGCFCILYNGKILSHHPISNTRFENIMKIEFK